PVVGYTGAQPDHVAQLCREGGLELLPKKALDPAQLEALLPRAVQQALIGLLREDLRTIALIDKAALLADRSLTTFFEDELFAPFDELCLDIRRFLLDAASQNDAQVSDRHLCTLDAAFECVPESALPTARELEGSVHRHRSEIRSIYGDPDALYKRYQRIRYARGESMYLPDPFARLAHDARRSARPSVRKSSAVVLRAHGHRSSES